MTMIAGVILIILGFVLFVPFQMLLPFPYGLAIPVILIIVGIWVLRKKNQEKTSTLEILMRRYAKGEITKEEFDKMKEDLS